LGVQFPPALLFALLPKGNQAVPSALRLRARNIANLDRYPISGEGRVTETVGSTATPDRGSAEAEQGEALSRRDRKRANKAAGKDGKKKRGDRPNLFARTGLFYRQIVAELRKVVWPSRNDLTTYTTVVIVFVVVIMALVYGLDTGFVQLSKLVFG
jgi:preprotein translocase subunit SecE